MARRIAARIVAAIVSACCFTAPAFAQDALALNRRIDGETVRFIVTGARPGEQVVLHMFDSRSDPDAASPSFSVPVVADGGGTARFDYPLASLVTGGGALNVRAFASDRGGPPVRSNPVQLRDGPSLYLLVDDADRRARVLCYDPILRALETRLTQVDRESVLAIAGSVPFAARDGALVRNDSEATGVLHRGESLVDLVSSADQSMLLALTREEVTEGRALLRLRLIEADATAREIASLEVVRGGQLVSAWLVSDDDSHRVLIWEREGAIREVVLGAEPGRGLTILPLSPLVSEELLDVAMHGDQLVVVTKPGVARGRRAAASRMIVFDLNDCVAPVEIALDAVARAPVLLVDRQGTPTAFVALETGDVAVVPLDAGVEHPASLRIPGLQHLKLGPDGGIYGMQAERTSGVAFAIRIDPTSLTSVTLRIPELSGSASHFGVFGDARRIWLYAVQPRDPSALPGSDEVLVCAEIDPVDGSVVSVAPPLPLEGHVQRVSGR